MARVIRGVESHVELAVGIVIVGDADADDPSRRQEPADGADQGDSVRNVWQVRVDEDDVRRLLLAAVKRPRYVDGDARQLDRGVENEKTGKPAPDPPVGTDDEDPDGLV